MIFDKAISLGGTISGEHGTGITKSKYLPQMVGPKAIEVMKRIKKAFDPEGRLNPGKIFLEAIGLVPMGTTLTRKRSAKAMSTLDIHDYGDVLQCMRCGSCLPTCPTYRTDAVETQSPRGRVAMIKAVIDGRLNASDEFVEHMYHCLDCRNCQTVCPAGVKVGRTGPGSTAPDRGEHSATSPEEIHAQQSHPRSEEHFPACCRRCGCTRHLGSSGSFEDLRPSSWISSDLEFMESLLPPLPSVPLSETIPR